MAKNVSELAFTPAGQYGMSVAVSDGFAYVRIPTDRALARAPGTDKDGKPKVYHMQASTGGWAGIPGTDLRLSVNAGFK